MTDQTPPEMISDDVLDTAVGGAGGANPMDLKRGIDTATAQASKRRNHESVKIVKRLDK